MCAYVCVCVFVTENLNPIPPGAAVIRQQSNALRTASVFHPLPPPRYLRPLSSSSSPRVKMTDTFKVNMMRCIFHFRLQCGEKKTTHIHALTWSFLTNGWKEKHRAFYVTTLVCGYRYISGGDVFKELLRHRRRKQSGIFKTRGNKNGIEAEM